MEASPLWCPRPPVRDGGGAKAAGASAGRRAAEEEIQRVRGPLGEDPPHLQVGDFQVLLFQSQVLYPTVPLLGGGSDGSLRSDVSDLGPCGPENQNPQGAGLEGFTPHDDSFPLFCLSLSSRIVHFPWQMSEAKVRHVLQEAFGVWSTVTPLRFREVTSDNADIIIDFNR